MNDHLWLLVGIVIGWVLAIVLANAINPNSFVLGGVASLAGCAVGGVSAIGVMILRDTHP